MSPNTPSGEPQLNHPKTDAGFVERFKTALFQLILTTHQKAQVALEMQLSPEQAELLTNLEAQYPTMKASLERRKISTRGIPNWAQIKQGLTPEVIEKSLKLKEPALLLIAPTSYASKARAILHHPPQGQEYGHKIDHLKENSIWNDGKCSTEKQWQVKVAEGVENIEADPAIKEARAKMIKDFILSPKLMNGFL